MGAESFAAYSDAALQAIGFLHNITGGSSHAERKSARSLMDYQTQKNKELFDYQNSYNTPAQQLARLREAGLNAGLMYGSHGSVGNAANASLAPVDVPSKLGAYTNVNQIIEQARKGIVSAVGLYNQLEMQKWQRREQKAKALEQETDYKLKVNDLTRSNAEMPYIFADAQRKQNVGNLGYEILGLKKSGIIISNEIQDMARAFQRNSFNDRLQYLQLQNKLRDKSLEQLTFEVKEILPLKKILQQKNIALTEKNIKLVGQRIQQIIADMKRDANNFEYYEQNVRPYESMLKKYQAYKARESWYGASVNPKYYPEFGFEGFDGTDENLESMRDLDAELLGMCVRALLK